MTKDRQCYLYFSRNLVAADVCRRALKSAKNGADSRRRLRFRGATRGVSILGILSWVAAFLLLPAPGIAADKLTSADVCVYGGTSSGVIAAVEPARLGKSVVLIEPGRHLG